jgi:hypothetical protein
MKKAIICLVFLLYILPAFSQALKPVKLDSLVTISLPPGFQKKDTLGQQVYSVNGLYGYMEVIRALNPKSTKPLKQERDLNRVLKDYVKGIQGESGNGSAQNVRDTLMRTLKAKVFTLRTDDGSGNILYRNFVLLYTTEVTYTFEYGYPDNRKDLIKGEYNSFIKSIKISPELNRLDQYLSTAKGLPLTTMIAIGAGVLIVIIIVIVLIVKRKRRHRRKRK